MQAHTITTRLPHRFALKSYALLRELNGKGISRDHAKVIRAMRRAVVDQQLFRAVREAVSPTEAEGKR